MDLNRLRTLRELAVRQTMAAVSEALFISPSAVSQQLALLEEETGSQLIERRGRGVRLTAAGQMLLVHAERIILEIEAAKTDLAEMKKVIAGEVRLAAFPSVAAVLVPRAIIGLKAKHPSLQVKFDELEPTESLAALRSWQIDAALVDDLNIQAGNLDINVETFPVIEDVFHVMLPKLHKLARQPSVALKDLQHEQWAIDTASPIYVQMIRFQCHKAGFEPIIAAHCNGFEVVHALTKAGCAISIIPGLRAGHDLKGVSVRKLRPEIRRKISLATRKGEQRQPGVRALIEEIKGAAADYTRSLRA